VTCGDQSWKASRDAITAFHVNNAIFRLCDSYIAAYRFLSILYVLHSMSSASNKRKGELVMANMDEVSKESRRPILAFGIAAISIVLLIVIGVAGENVGPNTQVNGESSYLR
jgi:hypothetical protein